MTFTLFVKENGKWVNAGQVSAPSMEVADEFVKSEGVVNFVLTEDKIKMNLIDLLSELEPLTMLKDNAGVPITALELLDELANCDTDDREYTREPDGIYQLDADGHMIFPAVYPILDMSSVQDLALIQRANDSWDPVVLEALADLAGLSEEWKQSDGRTFKDVIAQIEDKLDVDLWGDARR